LSLVVLLRPGEARHLATLGIHGCSFGGSLPGSSHSSAQKQFTIGELLLTDCSKTDGIMLAVLIVSDDRAFQTILRTVLQSGGFGNCTEAVNASEAVEKLKQLSPNLAVVDFSMPETNGLQLAQQLKAQEPALPIFMVTADYDVDIERKVLALGITAVFSKLDDVTTLVANARAVCGLA